MWKRILKLGNLHHIQEDKEWVYLRNIIDLILWWKGCAKKGLAKRIWVGKKNLGWTPVFNLVEHLAWVAILAWWLFQGWELSLGCWFVWCSNLGVAGLYDFDSVVGGYGGE
ncbi:hypothetical protein U1Q18_015427 [Sarracenia purpurea var. burkii]